MRNTDLVYMNDPDLAPAFREPSTPTAPDTVTKPAASATAPLELKRFLPPEVTGPTPHERWFQFVTRAVDIVVAGSTLLVLSPLLFLVALAVRIDSPGPALYRRRTTWMNRRKPPKAVDGVERRTADFKAAAFHQYKFRSMYKDARTRFPTRYAYAYTEEQLRSLPMKALLAAESGPNARDTLDGSLGRDPRLTRVGRWLRRTSVDEIPNLISVLTGEMSLVGGRPELFDLLAFYLPEHLCKFDMKPGVTGLAQVLGRGNLTFHEINAYDAEYVKYHSLRLYFWILWRTAKAVCTGHGAY